jgi:hypothetical protein
MSFWIQSDVNDYGFWTQQCGSQYLYGNKPVKIQIWRKMHTISLCDFSDDVGRELAALLQYWNETNNFRNIGRANVPGKYDCRLDARSSKIK